MKRSFLLVVAGAAIFGCSASYGQAIRSNPGFKSQSVAANDDGSGPLTPLGFTINFFGKTRSSTYVNNNGNITFDSSLATYTPFGLQSTQREIIAPFFADVDTRPAGSNLVTYGQDTVNGHKAFGANYINVGYYNVHADKLNSFQVVLIDRSDTGAGNFDIEFNYGHILWETGDASGGVNGYGGTSASVGWSNGSTDPGASFQYPGSLIPGSFLDNGPQALIRQSANTVVANGAAPVSGRLMYRARDGIISPGLTIISTIPPDATVGTAYSATLLATGEKGPFRWTMQPDIASPPGLTLTQDGVLSGMPTTAGTYSFTLSVTAKTEDGDLTVYARGSITIDPAVVSISTTCPLQDATVGRSYAVSLRAIGSPSGYTWSVDDLYSLPPGISLSSGGLLAGNPLAPGTYIFNLRARSKGTDNSQSGQLLCHLTVDPASVQLTSGCMLPSGTVGVPYSQWLTADGGYGPYQFQLLGQLPRGLSLTPAGNISGTPAAAVSFPFQIGVTDSRGKATTQDCSISVSAPAFSVASACPLPAAVTGSAYSTTLPTAYTWSLSGNLPSGLALTPDGTISGTPMNAGPANFLLLATDADGNQAGQVCSIAVTRGPLAVNGCPLPDANVGTPYFGTLTPLGGSAPYLLTTNGVLPAGIQITLDGQVSGTPTAAGSYPFNVTMREGSGQTFTQACNLNVNPASLHFATSCPLPQAQLGQSYSAKFTAAGGTAPYHFDFFGFLPDGLQPSADGSLSGTPQTVQGLSFLIRVTDAQSRSTMIGCSVDVVLPGVPQIQIGDIPSTVAPAVTNLAISIKLARAYSQDIQGQVALSIAPNTSSSEGAANQADPRLRFANGQTTATFTVPAGSTSVSLPIISTGTVASTVTVSASNLRSAGANLNVFPSAKIFSIAPAPPVVTSACYSQSQTGVTLQMNGYSTTRELLKADMTVGNQSFETDLSGIAASYFADPRSISAGGAFALTVPLDLDQIVSGAAVSVNIFNTVGAAGNRTIQACQ